MITVSNNTSTSTLALHSYVNVRCLGMPFRLNVIKMKHNYETNNVVYITNFSEVKQGFSKYWNKYNTSRKHSKSYRLHKKKLVAKKKNSLPTESSKLPISSQDARINVRIVFKFLWYDSAVCLETPNVIRIMNPMSFCPYVILYVFTLQIPF